MNLFGLGLDSKIEDVLVEIESAGNRLWNVLLRNVNSAKVHKTIYTHGEISDKDKVITMRDLVNMPRENILNVRNLGNKAVDEIKLIFKYCGINDIKGWENLNVNKRYFDSEKERYLEKK